MRFVSQKSCYFKGFGKTGPFFLRYNHQNIQAEGSSPFPCHQLVADVLGVHTCRTLPVPVELIDSVALCPLLLFSANRM